MVSLRSTTLGVVKGLGAGVAATLLGVACVFILAGGLSFAERIDLLAPDTVATIRRGTLTALVAGVAFMVWRGGVGTIRSPLVPAHRTAGLVGAVVLGGFFLVVGSSLWTSAAVGAGWAISASAPDPVRSLVRGLPAVLTGFMGLLITPPDGSVMVGLIGPVIAGVLLIAVIALETALD